MAARLGGREAAARPLLLAKIRFSPPPPRSSGHCTQPCRFRRATLHPKSRRAFHRFSPPEVLRLLRRAGPQCRRPPSARRPRLLLAPGPGHLGSDLDCNLGTALSVPHLRPYDEPAARLAASVSLVCRNRDHRSALPPCHLRRNFVRDRRAVWPPVWRNGLAQPLPLAQGAVNLALSLGLARIAARHLQARLWPVGVCVPPSAPAHRRRSSVLLYPRLRTGGPVRCSEYTQESGLQPEEDRSRRAVPGGETQAAMSCPIRPLLPHRGRLWPRSTVMSMLGAIIETQSGGPHER